MTKYLLFLSLFLVSFSANAHQPDLSSTMLIEQEDGSWVLQIRAALTAFEYEVESHYGKDSYATPEAFMALVLRHIEENTAIKFNKKDRIVLQKGSVQLGHETVVVFDVVGVPKKIKAVSVQNSSFKNIYENKSSLIILKKGFIRKQFILSNENQHTVQLKTVGNAFELKSGATKPKPESDTHHHNAFSEPFLAPKN